MNTTEHIQYLEGLRDRYQYNSEEYLKRANILTDTIAILKKEEAKANKISTVLTDASDAVIETDKLPTSAIGKILHIIKNEGRFLYRNEIIYLGFNKYNMPFKGDLKATLSNHASKDQFPDGELALYKYYGNAGVWGLRKWMTDGIPTEKRMFIKQAKYERNA